MPNLSTCRCLPRLKRWGLFFASLALLGVWSPRLAQAQSADSSSASSAQEENPFAGQSAAVEAGKELFMKNNCYACHGRGGGGGMGPSLIDNKWRYGKTDADLFTSIHDGRPKGMLGFGESLSEEEIWRLVTFVQSLNGEGGESASTGE